MSAAGHAGRGDQVARAVVLAGVLLLGLLTVVLAAASFASFASVKAHLDSFASDGDADVTRSDFDAIVLRLRIAAAAAALAGAVVLVRRRSLARWLAELASSAAASSAALWRGTRAAVASESRLHLGSLGLVTLAAVLVRLEFLFQPMRYDESVTFVHYASRPWYIALTTYTAPNNHVLHSELAHLSTWLFGGAPWAIRLPAFIAGVLIVPATYVAGRTLYGKHAGLLGAGLVAASSMAIEYSTNARGYTLVALCFVLLLALGKRLLSSASPAEWLAFALLGAIGFFTVPVMLYAFGTVVTWLVVSLALAGERYLLLHRLLPAVLVTGVLSALAYASVVAASGLGSLVDNEFVQSLPWSDFVDELPRSIESTWERWNRDVPLPIATALLAGFVAALVFHGRLARVAVPPALAALAFVLPVVVAQRVVPFERVWLFLLPLYLVTAAAGVVFLVRPLARRTGGVAVAVAVLAVVLAGSLVANAVATQSVAESEDTSTFRDAAPVGALLERELRSGDKVVVAPPADAILEYDLLRRDLDPAALLYWSEPEATERFLVVVKETPRDYSLAEVLADPRLDGLRLGTPRLLRRYAETSVYELRRSR